MQLRCTYCQTMFSINQEEMLAGLEHMEEHKQAYYDAHCRNAGAPTRGTRPHGTILPDWKKAIKTMDEASTPAEDVTKKPEAVKKK